MDWLLPIHVAGGPPVFSSIVIRAPSGTSGPVVHPCALVGVGLSYVFREPLLEQKSHSEF
jgi:hypothetical protein